MKPNSCSLIRRSDLKYGEMHHTMTCYYCRQPKEVAEFLTDHFGGELERSVIECEFSEDNRECLRTGCQFFSFR